MSAGDEKSPKTNFQFPSAVSEQRRGKSGSAVPHPAWPCRACQSRPGPPGWPSAAVSLHLTTSRHSPEKWKLQHLQPSSEIRALVMPFRCPPAWTEKDGRICSRKPDVSRPPCHILPEGPTQPLTAAYPLYDILLYTINTYLWTEGSFPSA